MGLGQHLKQKILLFALSIALPSCSGKSMGWTSEKIASTSIVCSQLIFPAKNIYRNLEVSFQRDGKDIKVFLNIFSIPFESDEEGTVEVTFSIEEGLFYFKAPLLKGNQRLLLPESAKEMLVGALNARQTVTIRAGKYSNEVTPEKFEESFLRF